MYGIFYHLAAFSKKAVFSEKMAKNRFWEASLFWREGVSGYENEYYLFYGKSGFEYFFHLIIFSKKATFLEKIWKNKIFGDMIIF